MPAQIVGAWTPDTDPNAVSTVTTVTVNGTVTGTLTQANSATGFVYPDQFTPAPPALVVGDVVSATNVTTDNQTPPLSSPPILAGPTTITPAQPAPTGVTGFTIRQVGAP